MNVITDIAVKGKSMVLDAHLQEKKLGSFYFAVPPTISPVPLIWLLRSGQRGIEVKKEGHLGLHAHVRTEDLRQCWMRKGEITRELTLLLSAVISALKTAFLRATDDCQIVKFDRFLSRGPSKPFWHHVALISSDTLWTWMTLTWFPAFD